MLCCGMNTFSGKWTFKCGLPCKSSVSGVTILVIPNIMGVAVWSPKLDKHYDSQKGCKFLSEFQYSYKDSINLLNLAKHGNLREIRRALAQGCNVNFLDYDSRSALHVACENGNINIVKYLVNHGASIQIKDNFGFTPLDVAKNNGFKDIVEYLQKCISEEKDEFIKD